MNDRKSEIFVNLPSLRHNSSRYLTPIQHGQENINPKTNHNYCSTFTPSRAHRNSSTTRVRPKIIDDEMWQSNKRYNSRVGTYFNYLHEKFNNTNKQIYDGHKSLHSYISQVPKRLSVLERLYPATTKPKLCLQIAVNGASKTMRGQIPMSNLNINNGDFGDDAGMFVDNRDYCFVGKFR